MLTHMWKDAVSVLNWPRWTLTVPPSHDKGLRWNYLNGRHEQEIDVKCVVCSHSAAWRRHLSLLCSYSYCIIGAIWHRSRSVLTWTEMPARQRIAGCCLLFSWCRNKSVYFKMKAKVMNLNLCRIGIVALPCFVIAASRWRKAVSVLIQNCT